MAFNNKMVFFLITLIIILSIIFIYLINNRPTTFHILIATAGRPSLRKLLNSLRNELEKGDAITIVFDGDKAKAKSGIGPEWFEGHKSHINIIEQTPNLGFWGHGIRNKYQGILEPKCTFVMHADDDDVYIAGSFAKLRKVCTNPNYLYLARIEKFYARENNRRLIIPSLGQTEIIGGDVSTANGLIPSKIAEKSIWGNFYGGDGHYYKGVKDHASGVVFLDEVIYTVVVS